MKITLTINGKPVEATIDDADLAEVTQAAQAENEPKATGYEKAKKDDRYYYFCSSDYISDTEDGMTVDELRFSSGNYYTDEKVTFENCRADRLMRNLRRFAAEHGGCVPPAVVKQSNTKTYTISNHNGKLIVSNAFPHVGDMHFATEEAAERAIAAFRDELTWYFTEYDPMPKGWWGD